jgi:hypothetical protein
MVDVFLFLREMVAPFIGSPAVSFTWPVSFVWPVSFPWAFTDWTAISMIRTIRKLNGLPEHVLFIFFI